MQCAMCMSLATVNSGFHQTDEIIYSAIVAAYAPTLQAFNTEIAAIVKEFDPPKYLVHAVQKQVDQLHEDVLKSHDQMVKNFFHTASLRSGLFAYIVPTTSPNYKRVLAICNQYLVAARNLIDDLKKIACKFFVRTKEIRFEARGEFLKKDIEYTTELMELFKKKATGALNAVRAPFLEKIAILEQNAQNAMHKMSSAAITHYFDVINSRLTNLRALFWNHDIFSPVTTPIEPREPRDGTQ